MGSFRRDGHQFGFARAISDPRIKGLLVDRATQFGFARAISELRINVPRVGRTTPVSKNAVHKIGSDEQAVPQIRSGTG